VQRGFCVDVLVCTYAVGDVFQYKALNWSIIDPKLTKINESIIDLKLTKINKSIIDLKLTKINESIIDLKLTNLNAIWVNLTDHIALGYLQEISRQAWHERYASDMRSK
jgi:hypothetical protein